MTDKTKENGVHAGTNGVDPSGADVGDDFPPAVQELAAACVRFVATKYKIALDFTPDTLSLVDQYARDAREESTPSAAEDPENAEVRIARAMPIVEGAIGAYLGEVIRRAHGGIWDAVGEPETWRVLMTHVYLGFNPIAMAREALTLEHDARAALVTDPAQREALEARLAALGQVDDTEYFAPTTRFDVIEIAVEALAAQARISGVADVRFTREDYD
ncbi:MAG: hypothetical protein ABI461_19215 [Polyangiaceae bacterium]